MSAFGRTWGELRRAGSGSHPPGMVFSQVRRNVQTVRARLAPDFPLQTLEGFSCQSLSHTAALCPETPPAQAFTPAQTEADICETLGVVEASNLCRTGRGRSWKNCPHPFKAVAGSQHSSELTYSCQVAPTPSLGPCLLCI